jgi:two-component system response regulator VicR
MATLSTDNSKKNILVVDDDKDICESIQDVLEMKDYKVITAYDGAEALSKFNRQEFDLIITDINMPKANGIKLIESVEDINKRDRKKEHTPFIVISGDLSLFKNHLESLDNVEIMPKPFEIEAIAELAASLLTGNKKSYAFTQPDELVAIVERIMVKISNSLLHREVEKANEQLYEKLKLDFDGPYLVHIGYRTDNFSGKLLIELEQSFVDTLKNVLKKNDKFTEDLAIEQFINILCNVFQKSVAKKFTNLVMVDTALTQGYCNLLSSKNCSYIEKDDYRIYNIALPKQS